MKNLSDKPKIPKKEKGPIKSCDNCRFQYTVGCLLFELPEKKRHVCSGHKFKLMF